MVRVGAEPRTFHVPPTVKPRPKVGVLVAAVLSVPLLP